jgi:hypothetical protein
MTGLAGGWPHHAAPHYFTFTIGLSGFYQANDKDEDRNANEGQKTFFHYLLLLESCFSLPIGSSTILTTPRIVSGKKLPYDTLQKAQMLEIAINNKNADALNASLCLNVVQ